MIKESQFNEEFTGKLPILMPIRLGEYGRALEQIWGKFISIRINGFYASKENLIVPRFSSSFIFHGLTGSYQVAISQDNDGEGYSFPKRRLTFIPPTMKQIQEICSLGITSSDLEFKGKQPLYDRGIEDETSGCADFWTPKGEFDSVTKAITSLRKKVGIGNEYITSLDGGNESATIMFAFDKSRIDLAPLMETAMSDNQEAESFWATKLTDGFIFPMPGSGLHMAIPVGLPANFIEYILVNDQFFWRGDDLERLKKSANCDGHKIPVVSIITGKEL